MRKNFEIIEKIGVLTKILRNHIRGTYSILIETKTDSNVERCIYELDDFKRKEVSKLIDGKTYKFNIVKVDNEYFLSSVVNEKNEKQIFNKIDKILNHFYEPVEIPIISFGLTLAMYINISLKYEHVYSIHQYERVLIYSAIFLFFVFFSIFLRGIYQDVKRAIKNRKVKTLSIFLKKYSSILE